MSRTQTHLPTPGTPEKQSTTREVVALRVLNEQRSTEGLARLQVELVAMQEKGIIDGKGNRLRKNLPAEMLRGAACDV